MRKEFDLRYPFAHPKFIVLFRNLEITAETPDDFTIQLFKSEVHSFDTPIAPFGNRSQGNVNDRLVDSLGFIKPLVKG